MQENFDNTFFAEPDNGQLRKKARHLYASNFSNFLPPMIAVFLLSELIPSFFNRFNLGFLTWGWILAIYPIAVVGFYRIVVIALQGNRPQISNLFDFCRSSNDYFLAVYCGILVSLIQSAAFIPTLIAAVLMMDAQAPLGILFVILIVLLVAVLWVYCRFSILTYLLATNKVSTPANSVKTAFRKTKGHVWDIIWISLSTYFLPLLAQSILGGICGALFGLTVQSVVLGLTTCLLTPYFVLVWVQFYDCFYTPVSSPNTDFSNIPAPQENPDSYSPPSDGL